MALTERLAIFLDVKSGGAVSEFRKVSKEAGNLGGEVGKATGRLDRMAGAIGVSSGALKTGLVVAAGAAAGALAAFAASGLRNFVDLAHEVKNFSRASGASMEESSRFVAALDDLGVESESVAGALFRLGRSSETAAPKLSAFGVAVARAKNGNTDLTGTLLNVADAYKRQTDPAQRAQLVFAAFGKQGQALIPVLEQGRDGLRRFFESADQDAQLITEADYQRAREYELAVDNLSDAVGGLGRELGLIAAGPAADAANGLAGFARSVGGFFKDAGDAIQRTEDGLDSALEDTQKFVKGDIGFKDWINNGPEAAAKATNRLAESSRAAAPSLKELRDAAEQERNALTSLRGALTGLISAERGLRDANENVASAVRNAADAQTRLDDLRKRGAVDAKQLESASRALASAERGVADAESRAAEARLHLDEVRRGSDPGDMKDGELGVQSATLAVERAQRRVIESQRALGKARTADERRDAELDLEEAQLAVLTSQRALEESQERLTELQQFGKEGSVSLADAQRQLADAEEQVRSAQQSRGDAMSALREAQAGDPDFARNLARAEQDVAEASRGIARAKEGLLGPTLAFLEAQEKEKAALAGSGDAAGALRRELEGLIALYPALAPLLALLGEAATGVAPRERLAGTGGRPGIPKFHDGGVFKAPSGRGEGLALLRDGERVLTPGQSAGSGNSYSVTIVANDISPEAVKRAIRAWERDNGRQWRN